MSRKTVTKIHPGQCEVSIVIFDGYAPMRSWVKKMTRRHALTLAQSHNIAAGTRYTVEHVVVDGSATDGVVSRHLNMLNDGVVYAPGTIPADYI